jgi:ABC-type polar amino acid transport system ATPase subunit
MSDIAIRNVTKYFGSYCALNNINVDVGNGEVVAIVGGSGSGKTTLLRCINRLETITSGAIEIFGADITRKGADVAAIRRNLGMVFQQINLYPHLSAIDNVGLALRKVLKMPRAEARKVALSFLAKMELAEKANAMPHQLSCTRSSTLDSCSRTGRNSSRPWN